MVKTPKSRLKVYIGLPQKMYSDSNFETSPPPKLKPPPKPLVVSQDGHQNSYNHALRLFLASKLTQPQDTSEHHCIHTHACGVLENTLNAFKERKSVPVMTPKAYFGHSKLTPHPPKKRYGSFTAPKMIIFHPINTCQTLKTFFEASRIFLDMLRNVLRCLRCHLIALKTSFVGRHTYKGIINLLKIDPHHTKEKSQDCENHSKICSRKLQNNFSSSEIDRTHPN